MYILLIVIECDAWIQPHHRFLRLVLDQREPK